MKLERKRIVLVQILLFLFIFLSVSSKLYSQVAIERSKDKVIISGESFYIHQVKKGETVYSIAKAYGISVAELTKENPPAANGINTGQTLRIPVKPEPASITAREPAAPAVSHDNSKYIYHFLKPGETVYFLSKTYDVSENDIVKSNPGIDITKLSVGTELAIPKKEFMTERQTFDGQQKVREKEAGYFFHKVESGESLSSIARKYDIPLRELKKANRDQKFPQVGDYVKIPGAEPVTVKPEPVALDTVSAPGETGEVLKERPVAFTPVTELKGSLQVAVLLPFYLRENSIRSETDSSKTVRGKKSYKVTRKSEDWIYPRSLDFVEMYQGILLAADTLRALGLDVTLHTYDIKGDTVELTRLINTGKLEGMDLIIGPVYSQNLSITAAYARERGIPVVSPVPLFNNSVLIDNPDLFLASSTLEIAQDAIAKKIAEYGNNNIVFIHSDTTSSDEEVKRFRNKIISELSSKMSYEDIKFREFLFYSRSMFNNDSINRLSHALTDQSENIIVIASEEAPVISETIIDIHSLARRFGIKVFGYPVMRDIENLDPKYFFDLDMMIYSPYWIDYSRDDIRQFNADFRDKFLTEPDEKSYAWQGYDIAYYFISGLAMDGREFIRNPGMHRPDLLETDFDFVRKNEGSGFENRNLFLVRYTKDYDVVLTGE